MPDPNNNARERSLVSLRETIGERHLTEFVFGDRREYTFFFDSDLLFERQFVQCAKELLEIEKGMCACLATLGNGDTSNPESFFIDKETSHEDYQSMLTGPRNWDGWLYNFGRFGCMSDVGEWCIYAERNNEIALIGLRHEHLIERYAPVLTTRLWAEPIEQVVADPPTYSYGNLGIEWRNALLSNYGTRSAEFKIARPRDP